MVTQLDGENNNTWLSAEPKPPQKKEWSHFMLWGKPRIRKGRKAIGALQSWGRNVGENGWQWFYEDYFDSGFIRLGQTFIFDALLPPPTHYNFTRDLKFGSTGVDVRLLQIFLNNHGFKLALSGPGSPGHETSFFGQLTRQAVIAFQKANSISPSLGYFGPLTRARVNAMQ